MNSHYDRDLQLCVLLGKYSPGSKIENSQPIGAALDVGVDCFDFQPVSLPQIREVLEREPPTGMVP